MKHLRGVITFRELEAFCAPEERRALQGCPVVLWRAVRASKKLLSKRTRKAIEHDRLCGSRRRRRALK